MLAFSETCLTETDYYDGYNFHRYNDKKYDVNDRSYQGLQYITNSECSSKFQYYVQYTLYFGNCIMEKKQYF